MLDFSQIGGELVVFLRSSWRLLGWVVLAAFVLEWILANAGLKAFTLKRGVRAKKSAPPLGVGPAFLVGLLLALASLALTFLAWQINQWLSFGIQVLVAALLIESRRLVQIGYDIAWLLQNKSVAGAVREIGRFTGRNPQGLSPYEMIGLTMAVQRRALAPAAVGPLFFLMLGGLPLMLLAKFVLVADWKKRDPLSRQRPAGIALLFAGIASGLTALMLSLAAAIMGFKNRLPQVSGIRYRLSDLDRNNRHLQVTALVSAIVATDLLLILRVVLSHVLA